MVFSKYTRFRPFRKDSLKKDFEKIQSRRKRISPPLKNPRRRENAGIKLGAMKSFFKQILANVFGSCLTLGFVLVIGFSLFVGVIGMMVNAIEDSVNIEADFAPTAPENILVIDLDRGFTDAPTFAPANTAGLFSQGQGSYGLLDTIRAIRKAQDDESIKGILLYGGSGAGAHGVASSIELRKEIIRFREESGRPVYAYLVSPSYRDYLIATAASDVWLHPFSEIPLNGLASSGMYMKNVFDNLGIGLQITRVGTHKSAVEPLISDHMSPEDREQRTRMLNAFWTISLQHIIASRNADAKGDRSRMLPDSLADDIAKQGLFSAADAVKKNLVDDAVYEDEMIDRLKKISGEDTISGSFNQISLEDYMRYNEIAREPQLSIGNTKTPLLNSDPSIAVVYAEGEIVDGYGATNEVGGKWFSHALRSLRNDPSVKAVVLRVNSPGGSVFASEQIRREAELLAIEKPVVVSMGDVAASGGYWISTPAKKVFAEPTTLTGSIGVFGVLFNLENLGKKIGVNTDAVTTAPLAELGTIRRAKTKEELAVFQKATEDIYAKFLQLVADARGMTTADVDKIAQGRVWSGVHAKDLNLVDELGGLTDAISFARKEAGLKDDCPIVSVPGEVNRFEELINMLDDTSSPVASNGSVIAHGNNPALKAAVENLERVAKRLRAFNDPNGLYVRLPFDLDAE